METSIIELSRYTAIDTAPDNKSSWTNKLAKPLSINQGDALIVNQCFVDCTLIDANTIFIENDVNLTFQYVFWTQNHGINMFVWNYDEVNKAYNYFKAIPDGLPYILVPLESSLNNPSQPQIKNHPLIGSKSIFIPNGIYEKQALTELINRQLQGVKEPPNYTRKQNYFSSGFVYPQWDANGNVQGFINTLNPPPLNNTITSSMIPLYVYEWNQEGNIPPNGDIVGMCYLDSEGSNFLRCYFSPMTDNISQYNYNNNNPNILENITRASSTIIGQTTLTNSDGSQSTFNLYDGGMIGASEFSLEFATTGENTGKFIFSYLHSPILNNNNEVVGTYNQNIEEDEPILDTRCVFLNAYSGIMFVNIYQDDINNYGVIPPLLEQMGFTIDDLIAIDSIKALFKESNLFTKGSIPQSLSVLVSYPDFLQYTTRNYFNLNGLLKNTSLPVSGAGSTTYTINNYSLSFNSPNNVYNFTDSITTEALNASNVAISSKYNTGHYLVELSGYGNSNEFLNNEKLLFVKGIVGNYMYSESFAMTLGPSSMNYIHNSPIPLTLTQIDVRILNPVTKNPDVNLGNNSSIYLQVIKEGNPPPIEGQPVKKENEPPQEPKK